MNGQQSDQIVMMQIPCTNPECRKLLSVRQPPVRIFNAIDVSTLCISHQRPDRCPACGQLALPMLGGLDTEGHLIISWVPVATNASAIVPPTGANMKAALSTVGLEKQLKIKQN